MKIHDERATTGAPNKGVVRHRAISWIVLFPACISDLVARYGSRFESLLTLQSRFVLI